MARRHGRWARFKEAIEGPMLVLQSPAALCVIVAIVFFGSAVIAWQQYGPAILQDPKYQLTSDKIEINDPPDWIRADIKTEVVRDSSLNTMSILDRDLVQKVSDAFAVHSWVHNVRQVRKFRDKIMVEVDYRHPVAMVEVVTKGQRGLIPVDHAGVILPTADFAPNQTRDYLRISIRDVRSFGVVGTPWDDGRVLDAAKISAQWKTKWKPIGLYRIVPVEVNDVESVEPTFVYEVQTRKGLRVIWGHPQAAQSAGEITAAEKITALEKFVDENGPLSELNPSVALDLRSGKVVRSSARTARIN